MEIPAFETFTIAILVLFVGKVLNSRIGFLREFNIPEPVTGGLLFAVAVAVIYETTGREIGFDLLARDTLLIYFFVAIGLNARFSDLLQGGKALVYLLLATLVVMAFQNLIGVGVAQLVGQPSKVGLLGGTISLVGGHGTAIAWAPVFQTEHGVQGAMEIGIACATFGLVLASLMGGPVAQFLVTRHNLEPAQLEEPDIGILQEDERVEINYLAVLHTLMWMHVAILIGLLLNDAFEGVGLKLPEFVTALFAGILLTNLYPERLRIFVRLFHEVEWPAGSRSLALISDISLGIFLAMSLMSLQLWILIDLALPILSILGAQCLLVLVFALFAVFPLMGRDYEAAVISAGFVGFSLGSTPTALANMTAVATKYGGGHKAFIVVPLVGAFFVDLANALYVQFFLSVL